MKIEFLYKSILLRECPKYTVADLFKVSHDEQIYGNFDLSKHEDEPGVLIIENFRPDHRTATISLNLLVHILSELKQIRNYTKIEYIGFYSDCPNPGELYEEVVKETRRGKEAERKERDRDEYVTPLAENLKITKELSVLFEKSFIDLPIGRRFWGHSSKHDCWMQMVKKDQETAVIEGSNDIFNPPSTKKVFITGDKSITIILNQTIMATKKKAAKKAAPKKTATKKATTPAGEKKGPTKKEMVAKFLKAGKKATEIVELMKAEGVETTVGSVRCFIQAINNGE